MAMPLSTVQNDYLNDLRKRRQQVQLYLVNGSRLQGLLVSFDAHTLLLRNGEFHTLVIKHMISTISPAPLEAGQGRFSGADRAARSEEGKARGPIRGRFHVSNSRES